MPRIAVIDIGTQSVLFLGVEISPESWRPLASDAIPIRLGRGLARHGRIEADRARALIDCVKGLKSRARSFGAARIVAFGTHVFRAARNRDEVIDSVWHETDIRIEILSEKDEAEWSFQGMVWGRGIDGYVLTADIGGGSTELISGSPAGIAAFASLPLGAVVLTERYINSDPPSDDDYLNMQRHIAERLASVRSKLYARQSGFRIHNISSSPFFKERIEVRSVKKSENHIERNIITSGGRFLASGGTATTLAAMELGLIEYDPDRADGFLLSKKRLEAWIEKFLSMPLNTRRQLAGLEPRRADIILAGSAILLGVMEWANFEEATVCDRGLRHGIVLREMERMQSA